MGAVPYETLVTVDLAAVPTGTELTLTHERFESAEIAQDHNQGWSGILDSLQHFIGE
jgi:hypothetical protein